MNLQHNIAFIVLLFNYFLSNPVTGENADYILDPKTINEQKCIPIPYELCRNIGYNATSLPNLIGLELASESEYSLSTFKPLIKFGCSSQLQFFLCSLYAPMCSPEVPSLIGPCRPVCEGVKQRCAPILSGFGFAWPPFLNCSLLPSENNEKEMCMEGPAETVPLPSPIPVARPPQSSNSLPKCAYYANPQMHVFLNSTNTCVPLCGANVIFSAEDKTFAGVWMSVWAVAVFFVCIFLIASFLLESSIFKYPERAAVYICLCYAFIATGYFVRLIVGVKGVSCHKDPELGLLVTITEGALNTPCAVVFLLLYYFSNGAGIWWVLLDLCWLLRSWKGFSHDQLLRLSSLLHVVGWGIPAVLTIACLFFKKVDSDELTGTCNVGGQNSNNLVKWVIVPQFVYIVVGTTLVFLVFASFWRLRTNLSKQNSQVSQIDVAAARVGLQAVLFLLPSTCMIAISFYELSGRDSWRKVPSSYPSVEVLMLKIFMNLATGLLLSLFLINSLVLDSWRRLWRRLRRGKTSADYIRNPTVISISKDPLKGHIKVKIPQETILQQQQGDLLLTAGKNQVPGHSKSSSKIKMKKENISKR